MGFLLNPDFLVLLIMLVFAVSVFFGTGKPRRGRVVYLVLFGIYSLFASKVASAFYFVELALLVFILWALLLGLSVDRKYNYYAALFFILLTPVMIVLRLPHFAEITATLSYVLIVFSVVKDLVTGSLYEN